MAIFSRRLPVGLLVGSSILFGFAPLATADAFKPSKAEQVKLGDRVAKDIRKEEKMLPDSDAKVKTLRRVADRLLAQIPDDEKKIWHFTFDVVQSKDVNAFALPGGPVFFYTGLIDKLDTEDQMAGVLAHELTHSRKEHWAKAYADQQKRALGLNILLILVRANGTAANIANIANDVVLTLPFSRKHETQADEMGFDLMVKAGFNPQGMVDVFEMLRKVSGGGKPPEWLSTHPDDKNRIKRLAERIQKQNRTFPPQTPLPFEKPKEPEKKDEKKPPPSGG